MGVGKRKSKKKGINSEEDEEDNANIARGDKRRVSKKEMIASSKKGESGRRGSAMEDSFGIDDLARRGSDAATSVAIYLAQQQQQQTGPKTKEVLRMMKERVKHNIMRLLPFMFILTSVLIIYFVVQYLLFERQQYHILDNSQSLVNLIESIECQEKLVSQIRNVQASNNTAYLNPSKGNTSKQPQWNLGVGDKLSDKFSINKTFSDCLNLNSKVAHWL